MYIVPCIKYLYKTLLFNTEPCQYIVYSPLHQSYFANTYTKPYYLIQNHCQYIVYSPLHQSYFANMYLYKTYYSIQNLANILYTVPCIKAILQICTYTKLIIQYKTLPIYCIQSPASNTYTKSYYLIQNHCQYIVYSPLHQILIQNLII